MSEDKRAVLTIENANGNQTAKLWFPHENSLSCGHHLFIDQGLQYQPLLVEWLYELVRHLAREDLVQQKYDKWYCNYCLLDRTKDCHFKCNARLLIQSPDFKNKWLKVVLGDGCWIKPALMVIRELAPLVALCKKLGVEICHEN